MEQHLSKIAFREPVGGLLGNKPAFDCALLHALVINSTTVVFHLDVTVVAAVVRAQHDISSGRFAPVDAVRALLDAVRYRIAHQMYEGVADVLHSISVE